MVKILIPLSLFVLVSCITPAQRFTSERAKRSPDSPQISTLLVDEANNWLGCPYRYGGNDRDGIDCSGLVKRIYHNVFNYVLPRTTNDQFAAGTFVRKTWIKAGDLLFFKNVRGPGVDHVGIYLGSGEFVHASTGNGVIISRLDEPYYQRRYAGARRYVNQDRL